LSLKSTSNPLHHHLDAADLQPVLDQPACLACQEPLRQRQIMGRHHLLRLLHGAALLVEVAVVGQIRELLQDPVHHGPAGRPPLPSCERLGVDPRRIRRERGPLAQDLAHPVHEVRRAIEDQPAQALPLGVLEPRDRWAERAHRAPDRRARHGGRGGRRGDGVGWLGGARSWRGDARWRLAGARSWRGDARWRLAGARSWRGDARWRLAGARSWRGDGSGWFDGARSWRGDGGGWFDGARSWRGDGTGWSGDGGRWRGEALRRPGRRRSRGLGCPLVEHSMNPAAQAGEQAAHLQNLLVWRCPRLIGSQGGAVKCVRSLP
jgi:hypothetical protein